MSLHDWADRAAIAQAVVAVLATVVAFGAAVIAWRQIKAASAESRRQIQAAAEENRKWKTLEICAQYEFSDNIAEAVARLKKLYQDGAKADEDPIATRSAAAVVLNYLDGIAIGVAQGLYIEELAKDHLRFIVRNHVRELFSKRRDVADEQHYDSLIAMSAKWAANEPYYKAK